MKEIEYTFMLNDRDRLSSNMGHNMRTFDTGATRDKEDGKYDYEAFLSPLALERYAKYMHKHRIQPDGTMRDGDNWAKGIPLKAYMKSAWRHMIAWWQIHRGMKPIDDHGEPIDIEEAICAEIFNAFGYLHEHLKLKEQT